jgi:RNA polymerase sigma-70 factor (ECF subfamily)
MDPTPPSLLQRLCQPGPPPDRCAAWDRFVDLYGPLLLYWARQRGLGEDDARDLVQDVFARLLEKLPHFTYEPGRRFRGYLYTLTRNCWCDRLRRRGQEPAGGAALDRLEVPDGLEEFREAEHRQHLVRRALAVMRAEFEPATWQACWQVVAEGKSAAEAAAALGLSENAVYIARYRVLRRLRRELEGLLD